MSDAAAAQDLLDSEIRDLIVIKYSYVVAIVLVVWDILLTFEQEVSSVWFTRKSIGRTLFLINRYMAPILFAFDLICQLLPSPSLVFCQRSFLPSSLLDILALIVVQVVLVMRTYALFQSKILLVALSTLCVISGVTMMGVTIYSFVHLMTWVPAGILPLVPGCLSECTHPLCRGTLLAAFWIPFFVLETIIFLLTVYKSLQSSFGIVGMKRSSTLIAVVYRDGLIYYFVIMSISVVNLILWLAAPLSLEYSHGIATTLLRSLQVTIVSRLLLNIRGMLEPEFVQATSCSLSSDVSTLPNIVFTD